MIRLVTIIAFVASLLLWSAPAYSVSPHEFSDEMLMMADPSCRSTTQQTLCGNPHCRTCVVSGHRRAIGIPVIGLPLPYVPLPGYGIIKRFSSASEHDFSQRLSGVCPTPQRPIPVAKVPVPVGTPPSSFVGGFFTPQQYQQVQPAMAGHFPQGQVQPEGSVHALGFVDPQGNFHLQGFINSEGRIYTQGFVDSQDRFHSRGFVDAYGNVHSLGFMDAQGNFHTQGFFDAQGNAHPRVFVDAQGRFHPRVFVDAQGNAHPPMAFGFPQGLAFPRGYAYAQPGGDFFQGQAGAFPEQRIVYVPFAQPPPIYVQRHGRGVPAPRPPFIRRMLGDANMYEYPQMPLQLYTTRGPRDFLAPQPPSIGY